MKFAIIAAGEGSRLAAEGIEAPKPLVEINGEALIDRLIRVFMDNNATEIVVICNDQTTLVAQHLLHIQQNGLKGRPVPLRFLVKSTPSSMHSFYEISRFLADEPFVLTTVDTIFREDEFAAYVEEFEKQEQDGLMGVTDYIEDESPLYVGTTPQMTISGFFDRQQQPPVTYISGGIYGLSPRAINTLHACIGRGEARMRNFQRALIADGLRLKAFPFTKVLDIDHASDILQAERLLGQRHVVLVQRERRYSPNSFERDLNILSLVQAALKAEGFAVEWISELDGESSRLAGKRADAVLSMSRSEAVLQHLRELEQGGTLVINSPRGVETCRRAQLDRLMQAQRVPMPPAEGTRGYWLKRGDGCAEVKDDVVYCADEAALNAARERFKARGIEETVTSAHVEGDVVKFYGVLSTGFFRTYYPADDGFSKFGDEAVSGPAHHYDYSERQLQRDAERLAGLAGVAVYGGDCIVRPDGTYAIIDFNDWPSFSRCAEEAARAIVGCLKNQLNHE